ncbi:MAG: imidazole glycerol phosphate synthase subunit HisH [Planctomycetes bacterium]|nr:imidazole glycerol phosphate synthase subunit HisH [Planctomycetota bacterium]
MSAAPVVHVVATGVANLASVVAGLRRAGAEPQLTADARLVARAPAVLLPGVGAFDAGLATLREHGVDAALRDRIAAGRPTLAICLGLQLLLDGSDESRSGAPGLAIVPGRASRFGDTVRVPQLGWNLTTAERGCRVLATGHAYFANSYRLVERPPGYACAVADHGGPFVAAVERGALVACQFHPELSGRFGRALLSRWLAHAFSAERTTC